MQTKFNFPKDESRIVYVRPVAVEDLPRDVQAQAEGLETIWSVHHADGAPMALVANRRLAMALARENDLTPVSVH